MAEGILSIAGNVSHTIFNDISNIIPSVYQAVAHVRESKVA